MLHIFLNKTALLVEDNDMNIMLFSMMLRRLQLKFDVAKDGKEALEKFQLNRYDIVLTDIHIPLLNGDEVAKAIRLNTDTQKANTPIIAITAGADQAETNAYLAVGINEILNKPFKEAHLGEVLHRYLHSQE